MPGSARYRLASAAVVLLGVLALLQYWLAGRRPFSPAWTAARDLQVTSSADRGPGSLREAIFAADSAAQRSRIIVRVNRVALESPLPPLVNARGIFVEADGHHPEIDASHAGPGPVFDVSAPTSVISGVTITHAQDQAVLARADGLRVVDVTFTDCDVGLYAAEGVDDLIVERSSFRSNRLGIWLTAADSNVILRNNTFAAHRDAAIWAVRSANPSSLRLSGLEVRANRFDGDRTSVVLGNMRALIEDNEFVNASESALYLIGPGAIVRRNRIHNGAAIGVFAHSTEGTVIENNEVDHNRALAVLVRSSRNGLIAHNRVYNNGYGIAFVLGERDGPNVAAENTLLSQQFDGIIVIGDSPIIRGNRALNNHEAGLRILDFVPLADARVVADPFLAGNTLAGNKTNDVIRGDYRVQPPPQLP